MATYYIILLLGKNWSKTNVKEYFQKNQLTFVLAIRQKKDIAASCHIAGLFVNFWMKGMYIYYMNMQNTNNPFFSQIIIGPCLKKADYIITSPL